MPAPWRTRRRERYSPREHDTLSGRQIGVRTYGESEAAVPERTTWMLRPGDAIAHAYSTAAGWMRSACRRERWTVALGDAPDDTPHCFECADLIAGEITELELRAMDGDR